MGKKRVLITVSGKMVPLSRLVKAMCLTWGERSAMLVFSPPSFFLSDLKRKLKCITVCSPRCFRCRSNFILEKTWVSHRQFVNHSNETCHSPETHVTRASGGDWKSQEPYRYEFSFCPPFSHFLTLLEGDIVSYESSESGSKRQMMFWWRDWLVHISFTLPGSDWHVL